MIVLCIHVMVTKSKRIDSDTRTDLARAIHQLKVVHGPPITAHLLYHQARSLTLEADRQAMAEAEQDEKRTA